MFDWLFPPKKEVINYIEEYEEYREQFKDIYGLFFNGVDYNLKYIKGDGRPLGIYQMEEMDGKRYTKEANAKAYFVHRCKAYKKADGYKEKRI